MRRPLAGAAFGHCRCTDDNRETGRGSAAVTRVVVGIVDGFLNNAFLVVQASPPFPKPPHLDEGHRPTSGTSRQALGDP